MSDFEVGDIVRVTLPAEEHPRAGYEGRITEINNGWAHIERLDHNPDWHDPDTSTWTARTTEIGYDEWFAAEKANR